MDKKIIKGYKGIIDLDLSLVHKDYIKSVIKQHYKDIKNYKKYQKSLKPEHRYENTIERINKQHNKERELYIKKLEEDENRRYELINKLYNLNK
jgi:hypothetical protein